MRPRKKSHKNEKPYKKFSATEKIHELSEVFIDLRRKVDNEPERADKQQKNQNDKR